MLMYTHDLRRRSNQNSRECRFLLGGHKLNIVRLFEIWEVTGKLNQMQTPTTPTKPMNARGMAIAPPTFSKAR